jgi:hypothetical protein
MNKLAMTAYAIGRTNIAQCAFSFLWVTRWLVLIFMCGRHIPSKAGSYLKTI